MRKFFYFLGSIYLAIPLIAVTALFVIIGTFIESLTDSHKYASLFTYSNPAFQALLALFFVNILVSALRRYPFKWRHVPFLITHLGLLMIIAGVIFKVNFGVQGTMTLWEGTVADEIWIPGTNAIYIEKKNGEKGQFDFTQKDQPFADIKIERVGHTPHSQEKMETWFKGDHLVISGLTPIKVGTTRKVELLPDEVWEVHTKKQEMYLPKTLTFFEDEGIHVVLADAFGGIHEKIADTSSLVVYDDSFGGYAAYVSFDIPTKSIPLDRFEKACQEAGLPFENTLREFLITWKDSCEWLLPDEKAPESFKHIQPFLSYTALEMSELIRKNSFETTTITLETPISYKRTPETPLKKMEDNIPLTTLKVNGERVSLCYAPYGMGLCQPAMGGEVLLRYQPRKMRTPHHVRLFEARKINYPGTNQPYSYEADLEIDGEEATLSMNHVYETPDGYRFYLSSISDPTKVKKIQLTVNRDPAKYKLTYPGGLIVTLGIVLLFWFRMK